MGGRLRRRSVFAAPAGYNESLEHFRTFFDAVRTRRAVVEDATFGLSINQGLFGHGSCVIVTR